MVRIKVSGNIYLLCETPLRYKTFAIFSMFVRDQGLAIAFVCYAINKRKRHV
jgi:hypothetical protein